MSWVVELLLPVRDPDGEPFPAAIFETLQATLTEAFGGVTAYLRAPAQGRWDDGRATMKDDIVLFEIMTDALDAGWWVSFRRRLEIDLRQAEIVVRAHEVSRL